MLVPNLLEHLEDLDRLRPSVLASGEESYTHELSRRGDDERAQAVRRAPLFAQQDFENRNEERERLTASGASGPEHVLALECEGEGSRLDVGQLAVVRRLEPGERGGGERQIRKEGGIGRRLAVSGALRTDELRTKSSTAWASCTSSSFSLRLRSRRGLLLTLRSAGARAIAQRTRAI